MNQKEDQVKKTRNDHEDTERIRVVDSFIFNDQISKFNECLDEDSPGMHKHIDEIWELIFGDGKPRFREIK